MTDCLTRTASLSQLINGYESDTAVLMHEKTNAALLPKEKEENEKRLTKTSDFHPSLRYPEK